MYPKFLTPSTFHSLLGSDLLSSVSTPYPPPPIAQLLWNVSQECLEGGVVPWEGGLRASVLQNMMERGEDWELEAYIIQGSYMFSSQCTPRFITPPTPCSKVLGNRGGHDSASLSGSQQKFP